MGWIGLTIWASFMQSVRTGAQKQLANALDPMVVAWVRFAFGLPFALLIYYLFVPKEIHLSQFAPIYWLYVVIVAIFQLLATFFMVLLLGRRNFAVGSTLIKSEAVFTALIGLVLFSELLTPLSIFAIFLGVVGLFIASFARFELTINDFIAGFDSKSTLLGLAAGVGFAISSVLIRQSTLIISNHASALILSLITLVCVLIIQSLGAGIYLFMVNKQALYKISDHMSMCVFIGLTSMLGSLGWFGAYALQNAAYVKTLGQIEFVFTLLITWFYFNEKIKSHEYWAIVLIILSSILIIYAK